MAITLIATPGAADANTYCTVAEGNAYFTGRAHKTNWENAGSGDKATCLVWATRLLDEQVKWRGLKVNQGGALRWPRYGVYDQDSEEFDSEEIPQWLKEATAEYAFHLLGEDRTLETNRDLTGFRSVKVDVIELNLNTYNTYQPKPIMPPSVWSMVKFYGEMYGKRKTLVRQ